VPWPAKLLALIVVAYALSPIDLIPDLIPVLGHLDDLILLPLGIALVVRLIPAEVLEEQRRAAALPEAPRARLGVILVVIVWLGLAVLLIAGSLALIGQ